MSYSREIHKNYAGAVMSRLDNRPYIQARGFIHAMAHIKHGPMKLRRPPTIEKKEKLERTDKEDRVWGNKSLTVKTVRAESTPEPPELKNESNDIQFRNADGDTVNISPAAKQMSEQASEAQKPGPQLT